MATPAREDLCTSPDLAQSSLISFGHWTGHSFFSAAFNKTIPMTAQFRRDGLRCGSSLYESFVLALVHPPPVPLGIGARVLHNLQATFRSAAEARDQRKIRGWDLWGCFPKEAWEGWGSSEAVTCSRCFTQASAALISILMLFRRGTSRHFTVSPPVPHSASPPFLFHILWVMHAFIPPNNFTHCPIRVRELLVSCPHGNIGINAELREGRKANVELEEQ